MTIRALSGLFALNAFVLVVGCGVLWGIRGWRSWGELLRLAGVAYLLGLSVLFVVFTLELVVGVPFGGATIVASGLAVLGAGLAVGRAAGRPRPRLREESSRLRRPSLLAGLFVAALALYFEALFRSGRLQGPGPDWDAWRAWTLRAKALFYSGRLDVTVPSLGQYPSYPPGLSALQAAAFHAMGAPDAVTLHLVNWFIAVGFVAALAGLLAPRVRTAILLPCLLVILLLPKGLPQWGTWLLADLTLAFLLAVAAVLIVLWLEERERWQLLATTLLLAGAMLTKREGLLFAAVLVIAGVIGARLEPRSARLALGACGLVALALALPWRIWFTAHDLPSDGPESGYFGFVHDPSRVWASLRLVLSTLFAFDFWLLVPALALCAAVLALLVGDRLLPTLALAFAGLSIAAATWVIASNPAFGITRDYGVNPVGRLTGTIAIVLAALMPMMLDRSWSRANAGSRAWLDVPGAGARQAGAAWAVVLVAALGYPATMLAGTSALHLPGGLPPFPSPDECVHPAGLGPVRVVFGYEDSYEGAMSLRDRVAAAGFDRAAIEEDGCGRARVSVADVPSLAAAHALVARARSAGFRPSLESER
jgi:hypothetical protein